MDDPARMETLTDALSRLRDAGYGADFSATADGKLACSQCDAVMEPGDLHVDEIVRFEGHSNPSDQAILFALTCSCGCKGVYSAAYGPTASAEDAAVLPKLAR